MKYTRCILLMVAMLVNLAASAHDFEVDGIYYERISTGVVEVTYRGNNETSYSNEYIGDVVIPSNVTYAGVTYGVISIGNHAFYQCIGLKSVFIPESVTSINEYAFKGCKNLNTINLPEDLVSIGMYAFSQCSSITSITMPESVDSIAPFAFSDCI